MPKGSGRTRRPAPLSPTLASLGERIRAARVGAGLSQSQLGRPHFTRAYVSALELGKIRPSVKSLEFLASRLGKSMAFFLADPAESRRREEWEAALSRAREHLVRGEGDEALAVLDSLLAALRR